MLRRPDDDLEDLRRCVGDVDAFAAEYWGRAPLLRRAAGSFDDLLDVDAVEQILVTAARRPTFRLVRDGMTLPPEQYTKTMRLGGGTVTDAADLGRMAEHVAAGATLVVQGLQRTWLPLARLCRGLERATSHPVQANAYLTPAGAAGLARHRDTHDVLVLQVAGTKGWDIEGLGDIELAVGDVVYLPMGTAHSARSQTGASLHITIGFLRVRYRHVVQRALDSSDALRTVLDDPLPLGYGRPGQQGPLEDGLKHAFTATAHHLAGIDLAGLAADEARRAQRRRAPLWDGHLRSVLAAPDIDDVTRLRRRADNHAVLRDAADGRVILELVDRTLGLPAFTRPALEAIIAHEELAVADLVGLDDEGSRAVLARRLVREGLLEIVA